MSNKTYVVNSASDEILKIIKEENPTSSKPRLYLDVDGTLVAMEFNTNWVNNADAKWLSIHRTDFCHWLNSVHSVLDLFCEVFVLTNFCYEQEKQAKIAWLNDNIKFNYKLILNKEGVTKALHVSSEKDILVDDTFKNLLEWDRVGGTQFAYQWVTCEKGRRHLLNSIVGFYQQGDK